MRRMLLALLLLGGCATDPDGEILTVINRTPGPVLVLAHSGVTIEPAPELDPTLFPEKIIPPGRALALDGITGYEPGHDVLLSVYSVRLETSAYLVESRRIPAIVIVQSRPVILRNIPARETAESLSR